MTLLLYLLIFLSGISALAYQVVWTRLLGQAFGVSNYALTSVIATFLAGLSLGSFILGRRIDKSKAPLRFFGLLEIGTALTSLLGLWLLTLLDPVHIFFANILAPESISLILVRVILTSIALLPATFLMGGTLPAIVRGSVFQVQMIGPRLSMLYAVNTLGALVGSLISGFYFIRIFGLNITFGSAAGINLLVGLSALFIAKKYAGTLASEEAPSPGMTKASDTQSIKGPGILFAVGISGFAALGMEILWTRMLVLVMGGSIYAYVTVLSSFLLGIVLGGFFARILINRVKNLRLFFGWIQLLIALFSIISLPIFFYMGNGRFQHWLMEMGSSDFLGTVAGRFGISTLVMLIPTTLLGMIFPVSARMRSSSISFLGGNVGEVYGANSLGNVIGTFVAGFLLLPLFGIQKGFVMLVIMSLIASGWGFFKEKRFNLAIVLSLIVVGTVSLIPWKPRPIMVDERWQDTDTLYYREGPVVKVEVFQERFDSRQRYMVVDNTLIGEILYGVDEKQKALAHFPYLIQSTDPIENVLTIGLGTGILAGELLKHPELKNLDCLEISPGVIEASRLFQDVTGDIIADPRLNLVNDDGVNFLRRSGLRYDAIVSDGKSKPGHAGNSVFYSRDYYTLCKEHITYQGVMIQWVPLENPEKHLDVIINTFCDSFPYAYFWINPPYSLYLVGSISPITIDGNHIDEKLLSPVTEGLKMYGWSSSCDVAGLLKADRTMLIQRERLDYRINTLNHPILEFYTSAIFSQKREERIANNLMALAALDSTKLSDATFVNMNPLELTSCKKASQLIVQAFSLLKQQGDYAMNTKGLNLLDDSLNLAPRHGILRYASAGIHIDMGDSYLEKGRSRMAAEHYQKALRFSPTDTIAHQNLGFIMSQKGNPDQAVTHFFEALKHEPDNMEVRLNLGFALGTLGRLSEAMEQFQLVLENDPGNPQAHMGMGLVFKSQGHEQLALQTFKKAIQLEPRIKRQLMDLNISIDE